ncbi:nucleotidyltransferase [Candidatus Peregrinibacteria bacterium]|nr:nucleotidyltransferase [Candidatus Peregrinibacteria bacterium]
MSVSNKFNNFCSNIRIPKNVVDKISYRYKRITKQLNHDFWSTDSETLHSFYVGSYGRDTDIHTSDIDMIFRLPYTVYERINEYIGNGQSALLAEVRNSLQKTYSTSHIKGDGQVIGINFDDGINFEIIPAFVNKDNSYTYPDSNDGGKWRTTNPKPEIEAIRKTNDECNGNLKNLCRMVRSWKEKCNVPMGGLLIDTLAYQFLRNWNHRTDSYTYYDWMTRDFFKFVKDQDKDKTYWLSPGSGQYVWKKGDFNYKAKRAYNLSLEAIDYEDREMPYSANEKWQEIYGSKF